MLPVIRRLLPCGTHALWPTGTFTLLQVVHLFVQQDFWHGLWRVIAFIGTWSICLPLGVPIGQRLWKTKNLNLLPGQCKYILFGSCMSICGASA